MNPLAKSLVSKFKRNVRRKVEGCLSSGIGSFTLNDRHLSVNIADHNAIQKMRRIRQRAKLIKLYSSFLFISLLII